MIYKKIDEVLFQTKGAFIHEPMPGFREDYICLHSLLRRYKPKTVFEIGTNTGNGVNVIGTALPDAKIYSLDLDYETMRDRSLQYPLGENGEDKIGTDAIVAYTQLRGDSMTFRYSDYPCDAYYIDGEHTSENVKHETLEVLKENPIIVIYHDTDEPEVMDGILSGLELAKRQAPLFDIDDYELYRVIGTRIAYVIKK